MLHLSHRPFATHHAGQPSLPRRRRTRPVCEGMPRIPPLEKARLDLPIMDLRRGPITRVSGKPLLDQASRSEWPDCPVLICRPPRMQSVSAPNGDKSYHTKAYPRFRPRVCPLIGQDISFATLLGAGMPDGTISPRRQAD